MFTATNAESLQNLTLYRILAFIVIHTTIRRLIFCWHACSARGLVLVDIPGPWSPDVIAFNHGHSNSCKSWQPRQTWQVLAVKRLPSVRPFPVYSFLCIVSKSQIGRFVIFGLSFSSSHLQLHSLLCSRPTLGLLFLFNPLDLLPSFCLSVDQQAQKILIVSSLLLGRFRFWPPPLLTRSSTTT